MTSSSGEDILQALRLARLDGERGISGRDLAGRTMRDRKLIARVLADLADLGIIDVDEADQVCSLSWSLRILVAQVVDRRLGVLGQGAVDQLAKGTRESAYLVVRRGTHSITIAEAMPDLGVHATSWLGRSQPVSRGDAGPVLLMDLSDDDIHRMLGAGPLPKVTGRRAPRTVDGVIRLVQQAREAGSSILVDQVEQNVTSVSAPVMGFEGDLRGALVVVGPSPRIAPAIERIGDLVRGSAARLTRSLGGRPFTGATP